MASPLRFSVVIPTYNRLGHLTACLASVAGQRHRPSEIIVVDDGSADGTADYLAGLGGGITVLRQANGGPGRARNYGAAVATGDYLAFLDSDDLWFPWSLAVFAALAEQHDRPALLFGNYRDFGAPDDLAAITEEAMRAAAFPCFLDAASDGFHAGAGMMMIARQAFLGAGGFAEDRLNAEDHDLALRLGTAPGFVQVLAPLTVGHRIHAGNEMADTAKTLRGLTRMLDRERSGTYPGGRARAAQRQRIIARHVRPAILGCIASGDLGQAARLYRATFFWNVAARRLAFLMGAPALMARKVLGGGRSAPATTGKNR